MVELDRRMIYIVEGLVCVFIAVIALVFVYGMVTGLPEGTRVIQLSDLKNGRSLMLGLGLFALFLGLVGGYAIARGTVSVPSSSLPPPPIAAAVEKKYCRICGTENKSDATYCEKCGAVFK